LNEQRKARLRKYIDPKFLVDKEDKGATGGYGSYVPDPDPEDDEEIVSEIQYEEMEEDNTTKLLRDLITIRESLKLAVTENPQQNLTVSLEAAERTIEYLRPSGISAALHKLTNSSDDYCEQLLTEKGVRLNNRTSRTLIAEGKMMISLTVDNRNSQHVYYFLYNDVLILFEDIQSDKKVLEPEHDTTEIFRIIPLTNLHSYYIPENQGIPHGIQFVFIPLAENVRVSFTVVFPTKGEKSKFIGKLHDAFNHITKTHVSFPVNEIPDDSDIIHQGFLVNKGIVMDLYLRVYVRLTASFLYYYETDTSYTTLGKISMADVTFRYDNIQKLLKWCTSTGRSFCFYALNEHDFETWKALVQGKKPPHHRDLSEFPTDILVDITVVGGRDLPAKDANGRSDPYCVLGLCTTEGAFVKDYPRKKTSVQYKTLKPQWIKDNRFIFEPYWKGELCGIRIDVWDEDKYSRDDFMGQVLIDPETHYKLNSENSFWLPLLPRKGQKEAVSGDLYVCVRITSATQTKIDATSS